MPEEIKERLSKTEYDKVGEMLLELIAECPYVPRDILEKGRILYQDRDIEKGIFILADDGGIKDRDILGGFTAVLNIQIAYQSFPTTNAQRINAQDTVDKIMRWLSDVENLPKLSTGKIIDIESSGTFSAKDDAGADKSVVFVGNAKMECRKKGE